MSMQADFIVRSPDGRTVVRVFVGDSVRKFSADRGCAFYAVDRDGRQWIAPSRLGLELDGAPPLACGFRVVASETSERRESWTPIYGQQSTYRDEHNALTLTLDETLPPGRQLGVELRVFDRGIAFRYRTTAPADIAGEATELRLGDAARGYQQRWPEDEYRLTTLAQLDKHTEAPLVVALPHCGSACVMEANPGAFSRMRLAPDQWQKDVLRVVLDGTSRVGAGATTPWRIVGLADRATDLIPMESLVLALAEPCALADTSSIKPGKSIREVTLSTVGGRACADFAAANDLLYILYDAGWYGFEYDDHADPRRVSPDPARTRSIPDYAGLDLPEVIRYARSRGVGVFLYVNRRALERYWREIIPLYAKWGVAGMKFGFVNVGATGDMQFIRDAVKLCAEHKLLVDIHDFYRPLGLSRTYPNLLTQEGTRGNEHFPTATHNVTLPFTRFVSGPADYTICYRHPNLKTRSGHQLAMSVVYYSPLQHIFWYSRPADYAGVPEIEFFKHVPTTWDETIPLAGEIGRSVAVARRSGSRWFLGAMAGDEPASLDVSLSFLGAGSYRMTRHADATQSQMLVSEESIVDRTTALQLDLPAAGGAAIWIEPVEYSR